MDAARRKGSGSPMVFAVGDSIEGRLAGRHLHDVQICSETQVGQGSHIHGPCVLGKLPRDGDSDGAQLVIGSDAIVRPFTTIYATTTIGDRFQSGQGASIREENTIGDDVKIGTNAVLEFGNQIANDVTIHSGVFLEMVTLEESVFIGPGTVFTDDPHPMKCPRYMDCRGGATVRRMARIGGNCTILPGVEIGRNSLVGAGSVVAKNVPASTVVVGNPARVIKKVEDLECHPGFFEKPYMWEPYAAD